MNKINNSIHLKDNKIFDIGLVILILAIFISGIFLKTEGSLGLEKFLSAIFYFKAFKTEDNVHKYPFLLLSFICAIVHF